MDRHELISLQKEAACQILNELGIIESLKEAVRNLEPEQVTVDVSEMTDEEKRKIVRAANILGYKAHYRENYTKITVSL